MDLNKYPLDLILVPLSLFLSAGYHVYVWFSSNSKCPQATIGLDAMKRRAWIQGILPADGRKAMLGVQSSRNSLMLAILSASIAIIINSSLAAVANNTYKSGHFLQNSVFGSQGGSLLVLKYSSASLLFLLSFLCSSMAVGCIIDASFLIGASQEIVFAVQAEKMMERGWMLMVIGNRVLCIAVSFLLWMFGPLPLMLSSAAMTWVFYCFDFSVR